MLTALCSLVLLLRHHPVIETQSESTHNAIVPDGEASQEQDTFEGKEESGQGHKMGILSGSQGSQCQQVQWLLLVDLARENSRWQDRLCEFPMAV